jgi:hypothetical protein
MRNSRLESVRFGYGSLYSRERVIQDKNREIWVDRSSFGKPILLQITSRPQSIDRHEISDS